MKDGADDVPGTQSAREAIPAIEWTVELVGPGLECPRAFTYAQLARMEHVELDGVLQQMSHVPDKTTSWRGPALSTLLTAAGVKPGLMMITLEASDGYRVQCTLEDLERAVVAVKDGQGRWLAEVRSRRPIQFVAPRKTADYWVRNLKRITVEPLDDVEVD
jgi:DMSO/TMAO reductase YedYZ molybdopterin-dependent catalytic subunit